MSYDNLPHQLWHHHINCRFYVWFQYRSRYSTCHRVFSIPSRRMPWQWTDEVVLKVQWVSIKSIQPKGSVIICGSRRVVMEYLNRPMVHCVTVCPIQSHFPDNRDICHCDVWQAAKYVISWSHIQQLVTQYSDVIMNAMATQITGVSIVFLAVCSGADQRKHQSSESLAFVRGDRWVPFTKGR